MFGIIARITYAIVLYNAVIFWDGSASAALITSAVVMSLTGIVASLRQIAAILYRLERRYKD